MTYSTSNTYQLKRKIVTFSNEISAGLSKSERKFSADMIYGMLASKSCLLTDIVDQLHEPSKKINGVDRLSKHLAKGLPITASQNHLNMIKNCIPSEPVVHLDDSDVIKPNGHHFESLGTVRDGSKSSMTKNVYQKGYQSTNIITFEALEQSAALLGKATFVMDRGYDSNALFLKMAALEQDYVVRLKSNRKLLYHNQWIKATELRNRRKGKIKLSLLYKGKKQTAY